MPYPTGRFFRGMLAQALRARLRSVLSLRDTLQTFATAFGWRTISRGLPLALTDQAISHSLVHISSFDVTAEVVVGARSAGYLLLRRLCPQNH